MRIISSLGQMLNWDFLIEKCLVFDYRSYNFHISFFVFFRTIASPITKHATNVPLGVLKKWCMFLEWFKIHDGHLVSDSLGHYFSRINFVYICIGKYVKSIAETFQ
jgi:hypothetical protein